ncbi:MAG: glycoside hydrolase family 130 protein [bacterium]
MKQKLRVKRRKQKIFRDTSRVITRLRIPEDISRVAKIIHRVLNLPEKEAEELLDKILLKFSDRHKDILRVLEHHFTEVEEYVPADYPLSDTQRMLIGAHFTMEYAIESAALFNPSIVLHPDQSYLPKGSIRFIMSLRATGEGHISSITFRSGIINEENLFLFDPISKFVETPDNRQNPVYDRHLFQLKLDEMNASDQISAFILGRLAETFTYNDLSKEIKELVMNNEFADPDKTIEIIYWLAHSNYSLTFHSDHTISERVIFPVSENEASGIEDARFVQFFDDNGEMTYYATYTAYNGFTILPQLIETKDFITFKIITLNGKAVQNKGMALFPRKINGQYVMLSRQDGENNHIMFSGHLHFWQESQIIQEPRQTWEYIQIGNCGSPLETAEGWLVLTHGVGAMRRYCIGAILLDLEHPEKIIGSLNYPLLVPREGEREGYVPNVVYTCGALIHNDELIIPYAMSDITTGIATVGMSDLMDNMRPL